MSCMINCFQPDGFGGHTWFGRLMGELDEAKIYARILRKSGFTEVWISPPGNQALVC